MSGCTILCYYGHLERNWGGGRMCASHTNSEKSFLYLPLLGSSNYKSRSQTSLLLKLSDCLSSVCNSLKSNACLGFTTRKSIMACYLFSLLCRNPLGANSQCHLLSDYVIEELGFVREKQLLNWYRVTVGEWAGRQNELYHGPPQWNTMVSLMNSVGHFFHWK